MIKSADASVVTLKADNHSCQYQRIRNLFTEITWNFNCVCKFVPNLSELTSPLQILLVKNRQWELKHRHNTAFQRIEEVLLSKHCLSFYDAAKPVAIFVTTSGSGLGAVLTQDNIPISYASQALT